MLQAEPKEDTMNQSKREEIRRTAELYVAQLEAQGYLDAVEQLA